MDELKTDKAYFFWTNGGGDYASELRLEIMNQLSGKKLVVQKLEDTERGKIMVERVNQVMSLLSGEDVDKMSWDERKRIYQQLNNTEDTKKHIEKINKYQGFKSAKYAEDAIYDKENENAAIFLVVGTERNSDGKIAIKPSSIWRSMEKQKLLEKGLKIDGVLLNGEL